MGIPYGLNPLGYTPAGLRPIAIGDKFTTLYFIIGPGSAPIPNNSIVGPIPSNSGLSPFASGTNGNITIQNSVNIVSVVSTGVGGGGMIYSGGQFTVASMNFNTLLTCANLTARTSTTGAVAGTLIGVYVKG